jgi:hypothetical protein
MKKLKNPTNPTPQQVVYRNRLLAEALRKNPKKATGQMRKGGGRCCLQVAEDVAISCGLDIERSISDDAYPHYEVSAFFGWSDVKDNIFKCPIGDKIESKEPAELNDNTWYNGKAKGLPHSKIAECVENTFVHPKNPKWSFTIKN